MKILCRIAFILAFLLLPILGLAPLGYNPHREEWFGLLMFGWWCAAWIVGAIMVGWLAITYRTP